MQELLAKLNDLGVKLRAEGDELRISAPPGALDAALRDDLRAQKGKILQMLRRNTPQADEPSLLLQPDPAARFEPFPLTDLQHAYWVGRDSAVEMGNVATQLYVELEGCDLDLPRLNAALSRLIQRHEMLRAVIQVDGTQRILAAAPAYRIALDDQSTAAQDRIDARIAAVRDELLGQVRRAEQWPLFEIRATQLPAARLRLHISLDLLVLDASSVFFFFREWHQLYARPDDGLPHIGVSFRDCVFAEQRMEQTDAYRKAHAYWMERVEHLPAAPQLPLRPDPAARKAPRFSRREQRLDKARWEQIKIIGRERGITPPNLLLSVYAEVLARWSASPHFTVNVTVSNRPPLHPDVNRLLGDFTSLILHEVDRRDAALSFTGFADKLQQRFLDDLQHRQVGGLTVLREWTRQRGIQFGATMPVVFSCGLIGSGDQEVGNIEQLGAKVYSVSQTSQVWLHLFVAELNGQLVISWDAVDAVFEAGVLDAMFATYCAVLDSLIDDASAWDRQTVALLPAPMQQRRDECNRSADSLPRSCMHAGFVAQARNHPEAIAILAPARTMRYGELLAESAFVADWLLVQGLQPGQPVAVLMHKGWEQVVAVYGVLLAGGAYMPIDADLPPGRQIELLRIGEVRQVLTQPGAARPEIHSGHWQVLELAAGARAEFKFGHKHALAAPLDQLAYIIFTSGTTGIPKGVMIDHRGAANTIEHINRLHQVGPQDRVLAVSSLSFDLSVYDIFGLLAVGGALVIPDHRKGHDALHWRELIGQHGVTLWNSAPQLMRMLMDSFYAEDRDTAPLRTVLLSGDFIPLDLPERIRRRYAEAQVVSLGGATEASIWSNYFPVRTVDPAWTSIPYGKPLPNQTIEVLDSALRPCPDHVSGRIYIGGIGLAQGYWRDAEKTASRFITHPHSGLRLYDTGDLGRYATDGNVLILGRDDGQVKIRGHRVELGEIEAVLVQQPGVRQAVVLAIGAKGEQRQLAAYVECAGGALAASDVKQYLAARLPDYMVPQHVIVLDAMPVSANGKIDYRALPALADVENTGYRLVHPRNEIEQAMHDAWSRVIAGCELGVTDNFFDLGGDSMMATQLVRELNAALPPFKLEMHELFENLTIEALAGLYRGRAAGSHPDQAAAPDCAAMMADVDALIENLSALDFATLPAAATPQTILLTGASGWIGAHVLAELLTRTRAELVCLLRPRAGIDGCTRLMNAMRACGIALDADWADRIVTLDGDLAEPQLGLGQTAWQELAESLDCIYHLGASLNVMVDYPAQRAVNVASIGSIIRLAAQHRLKPVFFASPMAVCRRYRDGQVVVLHEEAPHADPQGLLTGYAQSKWAAEQVLLAAAGRGLPLTIYRASHALPSSRSGMAKANDTYVSVLQAACAAGLVPDWEDSAFHGIPVDRLAGLMVEDALAAERRQGIVHLENRDPFSLKALFDILLDGRRQEPLNAAVSRDEWKARCLQAAAQLPLESASLAQVLFSARGIGTAVDHMFCAHPIDTAGFERAGKVSQLADLTPPDYWRMVRRNAGW